MDYGGDVYLSKWAERLNSGIRRERAHEIAEALRASGLNVVAMDSSAMATEQVRGLIEAMDWEKRNRTFFYTIS